MKRKRVVNKSKLALLKNKILKHKTSLIAGAAAGATGAVVGAGYGASVILNKMRDPKDIADMRESVFGIPNPFRKKEPIDMELEANKYRMRRKK